MIGNKNNKIYNAIILRKIDKQFLKIGEQKLTTDKKSFSFKGATFPLSFDVAYSDNKKSYLFFLYPNTGENGAQIGFIENEYPISVDDLDDYIEKNIIVGFLSKINKAFEKVEISSKIVGYIVVGVLGGAIGYIVRETLMQTDKTVVVQSIIGVVNSWL